MRKSKWDIKDDIKVELHSRFGLKGDAIDFFKKVVLKLNLHGEKFDEVNFGINTYLGKGVYGQTFRITKKFALKITSDPYEAKAVNLLIGRKFKNVVNYYQIHELKIGGSFKSFLRKVNPNKEKLYAIVMDYADPLDEKDKAILEDAKLIDINYMGESWHLADVLHVFSPKLRKKVYQNRGKQHQRFNHYEEEHFMDLIEDLYDGCKELNLAGIENCFDIKADNMGKISGNYVIYDVGSGMPQGKKFKKVTNILEV